MLRILTLITGLALMGACTQTQLYEEPESLGEFKLRVNYAFADKAVQGPVSRDATPDEWTAAIQNAVDIRLGRYEGAQEYDIGISLEGYMLAPPGIPVIYNPKSTAIVLVNVYDVKKKEFLAKGKQFQVLEDTTGGSALKGSGHERTKEEQMSGLALKVADRVEEWLAEEHLEQGWFDKRPDLIQPLESVEVTQNPA
ncbi:MULTISPECIES: hypothetical protein [unclassified Ruegeria]|uniref:hypothetical protein n=1 Tax=unclassified Ruegeria TaxID=2625375 RepID=UPI001487DDC8|nr:MULTISPECIES: hypothetical protein [unclassified Ruegeria]NOD78103.1 hypothetical protein [Ruegeria sp. HKCCD4332]NOD90777.1 hypothetical protein [Ruegeria sp. HKCCD4318]NOD94931.1 hypothetical protein [Ruegeria sp. HKCCD4884]NOE15720.1 hypothetical protein [Ruegeria sp. HKCCD4318-2]NOG08007.1 hypothetical protein [Ruegeria sp. HKCCD4315]